LSNRRKSHLSDPQLTRLKDLICASTGLWFSPERWLELDYGFKAAALQLGFEDPDSCARWLLSKAPLSRRETEILATHLAVGETYFFREKRTFNALQKTVLPAVIGANRARGARRLRIWSAGCATGEEVYSIAILLKQTIPDLCDWKITLMGTDINPVFLKSAVKGIYGEWSFRDAPAGMKESYFL
jgi:chemotaxis protein methyltransferase CheR